MPTSKGGTVTLLADGSFDYTPAAGFHGIDTFVYRVTDGANESNVATVTIRVRPRVVDDAYSTPERTTLVVGTANGILSNDSVAPLAVSAAGPAEIAPLGANPSIAFATAHGFVTVNANGSFTYTPAAGFVGVDTFVYEATDGPSRSVTTAVVTITVLPIFVPCEVTGYTTYTQGGWGSKPSGNNPGMLLAMNFASVYSGGRLVIGGRHTLTFTSASAIEKYLPAGGPSKVLSGSSIDPKKSAGVLSAQLLALQLAADFSRAGVLQTGLGNMVLQAGPLAGWSVDEVLAMANKVFGGDTSALPGGMSLSGLTSLLESIIMNYHEGADVGQLACPSR